MRIVDRIETQFDIVSLSIVCEINVLHESNKG
jgi:hypothetical protein